MSNVIGWLHPTDESNQRDGFNEPGIEHFRESPVKNLAREVIQNALDASCGNERAVSVKIKLNKVLTESIPNIDEFRKNVDHCVLGAFNESPKTDSFLKSPMKNYRKEKCQFWKFLTLIH